MSVNGQPNIDKLIEILSSFLDAFNKLPNCFTFNFSRLKQPNNNFTNPYKRWNVDAGSAQRVRLNASFIISAEGLLPLNTLTTVSPLSYNLVITLDTIFISFKSTSNKVPPMQIITIHLVLSFLLTLLARRTLYWLNGYTGERKHLQLNKGIVL